MGNVGYPKNVYLYVVPSDHSHSCRTGSEAPWADPSALSAEHPPDVIKKNHETCDPSPIINRLRLQPVHHRQVWNTSQNYCKMWKIDQENSYLQYLPWKPFLFQIQITINHYQLWKASSCKFFQQAKFLLGKKTAPVPYSICTVYTHNTQAVVLHYYRLAFPF